MREVGVVGVGLTKFGVSAKTNLEMFAEAGLEAIENSGLEPRDIDALFIGNCLGDFEEGQLHLGPLAAAEIGLRMDAPAVRFEAACATATAAFRQAALLVAGGVHDIVLVGGTERAARMGTALATRTFAMLSDAYFESPTGLTFPGVFGLAAHMYAHKYGLPLNDLKRRMAEVAVKNHRHGLNNPLAHYRKEITVDQVLSGPMVADPLQLHDCCPFSDGAAAVVVANKEKTEKLSAKPIWVAGMGQASAGPITSQKDITRVRARESSSAQAYRQSGLSPADVDVVELHDCFTIAEIMALEGLGLYQFGQGWRGAASGETALGGKVPVNPSGGLKAKGHPIGATGAAQIAEIVMQLRGECGPRQVEGARIGLVDTLGGDLGTTCNIILRS